MLPRYSIDARVRRRNSNYRGVQTNYDKGSIQKAEEFLHTRCPDGLPKGHDKIGPNCAESEQELGEFSDRRHRRIV